MKPHVPVYRTRNRQVVRVLRLVQLLNSGRRTLDNLAVTLQVSRRTIYRDLGALSAAHLPLKKHGTGDERTPCVWSLQ